MEVPDATKRKNAYSGTVMRSSANKTKISADTDNRVCYNQQQSVKKERHMDKLGGDQDEFSYLNENDFIIQKRESESFREVNDTPKQTYQDHSTNGMAFLKQQEEDFSEFDKEESPQISTFYKTKFDERMYTTKPRCCLDYQLLKSKLILKEIGCQKYNFNVDKRIQNQDHYMSTLQLSKDGQRLIITNLKPDSYEEINN